MKIRLLTDVNRGNITLEKGNLYEVEDVVQNTYKIKVPKKQKGKFVYALVDDKDAKLIEDQA